MKVLFIGKQFREEEDSFRHDLEVNCGRFGGEEAKQRA